MKQRRETRQRQIILEVVQAALQNRNFLKQNEYNRKRRFS